MNDLIKITKSNIGTEVINSVNAREIHSYLEVKTRFDMWINRAISKYDFKENIDFCTILGESSGGRKATEYIVTIDMAKELAMLEDNPKGKVTRKYFIEVEKRQNRVLTVNEKISLLATGHQEVEQRLTIIEHKIENDITLTSSQKYHLKDKVNKKAYELKNKHHFADDFMSKVFTRIWKKLKKHFVISSYMEIPKSKFDEACSIIDKIVIGDVLV